jgi:hypothetical protein
MIYSFPFLFSALDGEVSHLSHFFLKENLGKAALKHPYILVMQT